MLVPTVLLQTPDGGLQEFPGQRVEHHVHTLPSRLLQDVILKGAVFGGSSIGILPDLWAGGDGGGTQVFLPFFFCSPYAPGFARALPSVTHGRR